MIIVSQNKSAIINFEEIETIFLLIIKNKEGIKSIQVNARGNYDYNIGEYATEERAKEVLIEIMQSYLDSENYKYVNGLMREEELNKLQKGLVYEMPEE